METSTSDIHPSSIHQLADFPALASIKITATDLAELSRQGFVCAERRGDKVYHKLRFRREGKQIVRYLGNTQRAVEVEIELARLQSNAKIMRKLNTIMKIASRKLKEAKKQIEPSLAANGFQFHGHAIRQQRPARG